MHKSFVTLAFFPLLAGCATATATATATADKTLVEQCKQVDRDEIGSRIATREVCTSEPVQGAAQPKR